MPSSDDTRPYRGEVWRVVENQNTASTMRITETLDDQALLEALIDEVKPPCPPVCDGHHFLLATPFRYAPYPNASRFRRANEHPGVYYAAESQMTAITELAFYRMLFFREAPGMTLPALPVEHRAFAVVCVSDRTFDLTEPPLCAAAERWTPPTDYTACHALADTARREGVEIIRYQSARDPGGRCLAVLTPRVFTTREPSGMETWHVFTRPTKVQVWREFPPLQREFELALLDADPRVAHLLRERGPAA